MEAMDVGERGVQGLMSPRPCKPLTSATPRTDVRYGSSEKASWILPNRPSEYRLTSGLYPTSIPIARASRAFTAASISMRDAFQVAPNPMGSPNCAPRPLGPAWLSVSQWKLRGIFRRDDS